METDIERIVVVGAGIMGHGIAQVCAQGGKRVTLVDIEDRFLAAAQQHITNNVQQLVKEGLLESGAVEETLDRLKFTTDLNHAVRETELVIEAIPEKIQWKANLYQQLDSCDNENLMIATNTSGIPITQLAKLVKQPQNFIGAHFYMPAHLIPLVEIVQTEWTNQAVIKKIQRLMQSIGKQGILVKQDIPGFIGNRLQHALAREAMSLLQKGVASAEDIDAVVKKSLALRLIFTGPLEQRDFNGLDTHLSITEYLYKDLDNSQEPLAILRDKVANNDLGLKTGRGFYDWTKQSADVVRDQKNQQLVNLLKFLDS